MSYAQSLPLFTQSRHDAPQLTRSHATNALVVGNPFFAHQTISVSKLRSERGYLCFGEREPPSPLPGTEIEAVKFAALYNSTPLLGKEATEAAVRKRNEKDDIIHLSTHLCHDLPRAIFLSLLQ